VLVQWRLRREPLPELTRDLGRVAPGTRAYPPALLSLAVHRALHLGPYRPRGLVGALVLYRLLREQGDDVELVIGLPPHPRSADAHAWVELGGRDVGPPPGRRSHAALARFS
jgi:hypothetical protein